MRDDLSTGRPQRVNILCVLERGGDSVRLRWVASYEASCGPAAHVDVRETLST
jgi:hypothetical protein